MNLRYLLDAFVYYLFAACPIKINDARTANPIRRCACSWLAKEIVQDQSQTLAISCASSPLFWPICLCYRPYAAKIASTQRVQSARFVPTPSIASVAHTSRQSIKDASNKTSIKTKADSFEKLCVCVFIENNIENLLEFSKCIFKLCRCCASRI